MFDNLKNCVVKDLNELSKLGVDIGSALTKVKAGFFDEDIQNWSEGGCSTREATDIIMVMSTL